MKKRYIISSLILTGFLFLYGCGGGSGGAPGSSGSEDTGIMLRAVSIVGNPTSTDLTPDIDVALHFCDEEQTEPEEGLFRVDATITIDAALVNTGFDTFPASVEECTITYKKANEDPASPIIEKLTDYPNCPIYDGTNECVVELIDIQRKVDYWDDVDSGLNTPAEYPTHYAAVYECKYINIYGESGTFQVEYDIRLADFNTC
ncbi:MAG: hypothetical protein L0956_10140 [Candidatus Mariimomonas ferrooxydans]